MFIRMHTVGIAALAFCGAAGLAGAQDAGEAWLTGSAPQRGSEAPVRGADLLAIDTMVIGDDAIAYINTSPPSFAVVHGDIPEVGACPEIEYGQDGYIYALDTADNTKLHRLTIHGDYLKSFTIEFPEGYDVLTAAEWVNGGLVVALATEGGGGVAGIGRLELDNDADTATFVVSPTSLGFNGALGGLAFDPGEGLFYAVVAGGASPQLLAISGLGVPTVIGTLMEGDQVAPGMTGLEFASDGQLYAVPNTNTGRGGELFIVNRSNAQCMSLGFTGNEGIVGITSRAGCSQADLAFPFGTLDFSDVANFLTYFGAGCP
jgi:hypothetical protein